MHDPSMLMDDSLDSKARNRANQRRSRQRQKDHIQSLEAKLAEYEKHGAQASKAIQIAARKVADENRRLRELLVVLGAAPGEIEAYLAGSISMEELSVARARATAFTGPRDKKHRTPRQQERATAQVLETPQVPETPQLPEIPVREDQSVALATNAQSAEDSLTKAQEDALPSESLDQEAKQLMSKARPSTDSPQPDETDCEDAARIIAGMRGVGHPDDVRSELGCMPGGKCHIKNSRIFDLIDQ